MFDGNPFFAFYLMPNPLVVKGVSPNLLTKFEMQTVEFLELLTLLPSEAF
jgi:hypothetical protein